MEYIDKDNNNNKDNNNEKGISALGLDKDLGFSQGHQGHPPHEDNDKGDTNNKDGSNNMYDNDDKIKTCGFRFVCAARKFGKKAVKSTSVELQKCFLHSFGVAQNF